MSDVFVSYSHHDVERAGALAAALEARGWSVWWDPQIRSGESFVSLINREITAASSVVVLWSKRSVTSRWVLEEAHYGLNRGILCPIVIERDVQLPVGFATIKYIALWDWQGAAPSSGYVRVIGELERLLGPPKPLPAYSEHAITLEPTSAGLDQPRVPRPSEVTNEPPRAQIDGYRAADGDRYIDFSDLNWIAYSAVTLFFGAFLAFGGSFAARLTIAQPWTLAETLAVAAFAVASFLGAALAERNHRSIRSPISLRALGGTIGHGLAVSRGLISGGLYLTVAYILAMRGLTAYRSKDVLLDTDIPLSLILGLFAIAFLAMASSNLLQIAPLSWRRAKT